MSRFNCFFQLAGKKKKNKDKDFSKGSDYNRKLKTLNVMLESPAKTCEPNGSNSTSFTMPVPFSIPENARCNVKVTKSHDSPVKDEAMEVAYEGGDEHEENQPIKKDFSDHVDLHTHSLEKKSVHFDQFENPSEKDDDDDDAKLSLEIMQSGHVSDPGTRKAEFLASPKLKRSCSNLETRSMFRRNTEQASMLHTYLNEELEKLVERGTNNFRPHHQGSPTSIMTRCSADKVMLKKHSSSQILPSGSRKIWWKLFLWSHRNMSMLWTNKNQVPENSNFNQQGGYSSDTLEPSRALKLDQVESPISKSRLWPQNQWLAFSAESPLSRVDEWMKELPIQPQLLKKEDDNDCLISYPPSPARSSTPTPTQSVPEEILHANRVIQSLNSSSTVAHIAGTGLKVIPSLSIFSSLRCVNLSNNSIVHVSPGSLPKGLHALNLSRNKITSIEGFRELTRLRVLDLSYNRLTRIGHGLSNCTIIKELYLSGNKIGEIEGLHRLLKLTVLDLSFNKITTTKALGQLVANYQSLLALNLLGNPVQINVSDDLLRKNVCSLLPKLAYLNKEAVDNQKAREIKESVGKSALGNNSWNSRKRSTKRASHGRQISSGSGHRQRSASRTPRHGSMLRIDSSAVRASPSYSKPQI
ncbi:uncharacterized protein LOC124944901 [Impatiens glandulifera]|uniref:uncharacterized protein LOC124944901 n=1 Tax=Impatiens glandulifera TaxID=253017 RepID=UPI001FB0FF1B|nr:uncharacterized protein LOC124944901 [Impatiens glandulifera]